MLFKKKEVKEESKKKREPPLIKSDITREMVKEQLQREIDKYNMNMKIKKVALKETDLSAWSGLWDDNASTYCYFESQKWAIDIGNEQFYVNNSFSKDKRKVLFDAKGGAKGIILQTGKKLSPKARSMFGGATVINNVNELVKKSFFSGDIYLTLGYCNICKKKAPLITRSGIVAKNYWDVVPEICPYCLFREAGYDIKIHKLPSKHRVKEEGER